MVASKCRLCLHEKEHLRDLRDHLDKAELLLRLLDSDLLPKGLCRECEDTLNGFQIYREQVCINQNKLAAEIVKSEEIEVSVDVTGGGLVHIAGDLQINPSSDVSQEADAVESPGEHNNRFPKDTATSTASEREDSKSLSSDDSYTPIKLPRKRLGKLNSNNKSVKVRKKSKETDCEQHKNDKWTEEGIQKRKQQEEFIRTVMPITCSICDNASTEYESFRELSTHFKNVHGTTKWFIRCTLCKNQYRRQAQLYKHLLVHRNPDTFKCDICGKTSASYNCLQEHKKTHLTDEQKTFQCENCPRKYATSTGLNNHRIQHIPVQERKFSCTECNKRCPTQALLNTHMRDVHSGQSFVCEICAKSYRTRGKLKEHFDLKHVEKGTQPKLKCHLCDKILLNAYTFQKHIRTVHEEAGQYPCQECGHVAPNKRAHDLHNERVHKPRKVIRKCAVCGRMMRTLRGFKEHMAIHSGDMLYKCKFCPREMNSNGNMYNHLKACHPVEWAEYKRTQYEADAALVDQQVQEPVQ